MQRHDSYCVLCRSRCGARYLTEGDRLVGVEPWPEHPTGGGLCAKGRAAPELQHHPQRLARPLRRTTPRGAPDPRWQEVSWDEALADIARRLLAIQAEHGAHAVAFASASPGASGMSDSLEWLERLIYAFGSPNFLTGVELCNWHRDHNHAYTFGTGIGMPDYASTELVLLWGFNPGNVWLAQANELARARARGAKLLVIDPVRTRHARDADLWLQVRPGTDAALALGLARELLHGGGHDQAFVRQWTNACFLVREDTGRWLRAGEVGLAGDAGAAGRAAADAPVGWLGAGPVALDTSRALPDGLALQGRFVVQGIACRTAFDLYMQACEPWTPQQVEAATGVPAARVVEAARLLARSRRTSYFSWTGIAQHAHATQTDRAIALLYALTGCVDAPGGNRHLRRLPVHAPNDRRLLDPQQAALALGLQQRPLGPPAHGWAIADDFQRSVLEGEPYRVRALVGFGANLVLSQPDSARTAAALDALEFQVHCDLFENPTARHADYLLPVRTPWEREGLRIGFEIGPRAIEHVQLRRPVAPPPAGNLARSDLEIVFDLAVRLGLGRHFHDGDIERAWNHVLAPIGLTLAQLREQPQGVRVPVQQQERAYAARGFDTPSRRIEIHSDRFAAAGIPPVPTWVAPAVGGDPDFPYTLSCAKSGYYCQSQHRALPSLRQREPEPAVRLHPALAQAHGIAAGDAVEVRTRGGVAVYRAELDEALPRDVVHASFGWWQGCDELGLPAIDPLQPGSANPNALVDAALLDGPSGSAPLRSQACAIRRADGVPGWDGALPAEARCVGWPSPRVLELSLRAADGRLLPDYRPGQHVRVAFDLPGLGGQERCYSLVGAAFDPQRRELRVAVGLARHGGAVSAALHEAFRADPRAVLAARLRRPSGRFLLPVQPSRPVVLLAAGVGITPFMALLKTWAAGEQPRVPVLLLHGCRDAAEQPFADRLRAWHALLPMVQVRVLASRQRAAAPAGQPCVSARDDAVDAHGRDDRAPPWQAGFGSSGAPCLPGRITADAIDARWIRDRATFHVCGPDGMARELAEGLVARGVPRHDVFSESFQLASGTAPVSSEGCRVRFVRSGIEARWTSGEGNLLALAQRLGVALPGSCRVGQCETCRVPLRSGQVWHASEPAVLEPGACLACVAVPVTDVEVDA